MGSLYMNFLLLFVLQIDSRNWQKIFDLSLHNQFQALVFCHPYDESEVSYFFQIFGLGISCRWHLLRHCHNCFVLPNMSDDFFLFVAGNILHFLSNYSDLSKICVILQVYLDRGHRIPFENYEDFNEENFHNGVL